MIKKKENIFKLLYSEYKNKNYSRLFHYNMKSLECFFSGVLVYLVASTYNESTISTVALIATSLSLILNVFLLTKKRQTITRVSTEEIKDYLFTIDDKKQRKNKVKMLASCMLSNKDTALFLDDFIMVKRKDIEIDKPDNQDDYEKIIESLSFIETNQKIKELV